MTNPNNTTPKVIEASDVPRNPETAAKQNETYTLEDDIIQHAPGYEGVDNTPVVPEKTSSQAGLVAIKYGIGPRTP